MNTISVDKQYKTRDGRDARVLCVDRPGGYSVVTVVDADVLTYTADGTYMRGQINHRYDLIEVQRTVVKWLTVFKSGASHTCDTEEHAIRVAEDRGGDVIIRARRIEMEVD